MSERLQIVDSHTEGEPTRVVVEGFPDLRGATMAERREDFRTRFDHLRRGLILEPRGHDAIVGAVLTAPVSTAADAGVIFFNDAGYLGMCGHGTIGVAETLRWLGRLSGDRVSLDTPVGAVTARFEADGRVTIRNVASRSLGRRRLEGRLSLAGQPTEIHGEVAYGGNWFFFVELPLVAISVQAIPQLLAEAKSIRDALTAQGIAGDDGGEIDHIELFAHDNGRIKNFVLCPGGAYDRSPCGTGTSAKLACLAANGELAPGETIELESVTGGKFSARYTVDDGQVIPWITGRAFVTGLMQPVFSEGDPFVYGF